jgi:uncharacterized protein (TIGR02145 family)
MKKSIMYTLGIAVLFCAACVDNSTNGSGGGEVDALLEKYNNPNGGNGGGGGGGGGGDGNSLVLGNGQAWTYGNFGLIFTSNNRIIEIYKVGDSWWYADTGIYQTSGDIITIDSKQWTYSILGNTLSLSKYTYTFAKTNGVSPKTGMGVVSFTDSRDGKSYKAIKINTQIWMAENLNYDVPNVSSDVCYDNNTSYCATYGRLYTWEEAKSACPAGWHLPSDVEWVVLIDYADYYWETASTKLKAKSGWDGNYNGTDEYGFSALPGGFGSLGGNFYRAGNSSIWWSAAENIALIIYSNWGVDYYNEYVYGIIGDEAIKFSVRCVQD